MSKKQQYNLQEGVCTCSVTKSVITKTLRAHWECITDSSHFLLYLCLSSVSQAHVIHYAHMYNRIHVFHPSVSFHASRVRSRLQVISRVFQTYFSPAVLSVPLKGWGVPRPDVIDNPSSDVWIYSQACSQLDVSGIPPKGDAQETFALVARTSLTGSLWYEGAVALLQASSLKVWAQLPDGQCSFWPGCRPQCLRSRCR